MRRLALLALVVPALSACGWSPFSAASGAAPHGPPRRAMVVSGGGALTDNSRDSYVAWGSFLVSATEGPVETPLPVYSTVTDLHVSVTTPPGDGASWTLTVDKNGSATALTCSIAGAATTCSDSSRVPGAVADKIDLDVTPFNAPALATITWSVKALP